MKKDVWLTISSQQQFAGCDEENIDLQTAATLYERGGKYYIAYEESELTGLEGTKTTVKLDGKTVALIRTGTFPSHMLFAEDERMSVCIRRRSAAKWLLPPTPRGCTTPSARTADTSSSTTRSRWTTLSWENTTLR